MRDQRMWNWLLYKTAVGMAFATTFVDLALVGGVREYGRELVLYAE